MALYEITPRSDLPELPNFTQLSERVWRVMGLNPGKFTLQGTNTYLIGKGTRKILIDCGDGHPDYVPLLVKSLKSIHPEAYISDILISHWHTDHWGGLEDILNSDLNKSSQDSAQLQNIKVHKYPLPSNIRSATYFNNRLQKLPDYLVFTDLDHEQLFQVDDDTHLRILYTPGHAKDHCAFYLVEEDTVFTADCILGHGSVAFDDLTEYICTLQKIKELNPARLFPGHGAVVDEAIEKVDQYLSLRMAKEKQILDIFLRDTSATWTPIELVETINEENNKEYTEQLLAVVVRTVGLHLIKLYYDGKIELIHAQKIKETLEIDPYDAENVFSIVNKKWRYIGDNKVSKL